MTREPLRPLRSNSPFLLNHQCPSKCRNQARRNYVTESCRAGSPHPSGPSSRRILQLRLVRRRSLLPIANQQPAPVRNISDGSGAVLICVLKSIPPSLSANGAQPPLGLLWSKLKLLFNEIRKWPTLTQPAASGVPAQPGSSGGMPSNSPVSGSVGSAGASSGFTPENVMVRSPVLLVYCAAQFWKNWFDWQLNKLPGRPVSNVVSKTSLVINVENGL